MNYYLKLVVVLTVAIASAVHADEITASNYSVPTDDIHLEKRSLLTCLGLEEDTNISPELFFVKKSEHFKFHAENVTLKDLEENGFNPDALTSFIIHGFASGYPSEGWMSSIVNESRKDDQTQEKKQTELVSHNLFIVSWHHAARGPPYCYIRAAANIQPVSEIISSFINKILIEEARIPARRIQLVGHSLGAHLSGSIAKKTSEKVGRIVGLDPAGPLFKKSICDLSEKSIGDLIEKSIGDLFVKDNERLTPDDANQVVSIHTDTNRFGIKTPLGRYSIYVEGGETQPGCPNLFGGKSSNLWKSFKNATCNHSRANILLTDQLKARTANNCTLVAYQCNSWEDFTKGFCGVCNKTVDSSKQVESLSETTRKSPLDPVECIRVGLEWQYRQQQSSSDDQRQSSSAKSDEVYSGTELGYDSDDKIFRRWRRRKV